ncbi:hypothetical protein GQ457_02G025710 [Hibiscus cannabinus]
MSRQSTSPESLPRAEERKIRKGLRFHQQNSLKHPYSMRESEGRPRIVKVKDLKPKHIKDYLEYKNEVNTVHVRDQKHELTPPRNRYPCDNGYKEVTVLPSRDTAYDQVKQLIGLRHKPIT